MDAREIGTYKGTTTKSRRGFTGTVKLKEALHDNKSNQTFII